MSNIKEVSVTLTPADQSVLESRPRRRTRKQKGGLDTAKTEEPVGIASPLTESAMNFDIQSTAAQAPAVSMVPTQALTQAPAISMVPTQTLTQAPVVSMVPTQAPAVSMVPTQAPAVSMVPTQEPTPAQIPAPSGGVRIQTRKRHSAPVSRKAIIIPVKRHKAPMKDKPKLVIPVGGAGAQTGAESMRKVGGKRFTERRLSISMKAMNTTRKTSKSIRKQVAAMSVEQLRKTLLEKKLIKPKSNPPEAMLRSLMKEYLSLAKA